MFTEGPIAMIRRDARFTQADIALAIKAIKQTGANMAVEIAPDGTIRLVPYDTAGKSSLPILSRKGSRSFDWRHVASAVPFRSTSRACRCKSRPRSQGSQGAPNDRIQDTRHSS